MIPLVINIIKGAIVRRLEKRMFQKLLAKTEGKLTYASIGALALGLVASKLGITITTPEIDAIISGLVTIAALYGRYRATQVK